MRFSTITSAYSLFFLLDHIALSHQARTLRGNFDSVDNEHEILPAKPTNGGKNTMISLSRAATEHESPTTTLLDSPINVLKSKGWSTERIEMATTYRYYHGSATELHVACRVYSPSADYEVAKALLELGSDVNAEANGGIQALFGAAGLGDRNFCDLLLDYGADVSHAIDDGRTASDNARNNGYIELADYLDSITPVVLDLRNNPTSQSSTRSAGGASSRGVDGNKDSTFSNGGQTHTLTENNPWWQVCLMNNYKISSINIYNRLDCCSDRLDGFVISIYHNGDLAWRYEHPSGTPPYETIVSVPNIIGDRVKVSLPGNDRILTLAEVEITASSVSSDTTNTPTNTPTNYPSSEPSSVPTQAPTDIMDTFEYIGSGGCLSASGERSQVVQWLSMPKDKRSANDCAQKCVTDFGRKDMFGFDIGYGRCRCFFPKEGYNPYPVKLNTNGGYKCWKNASI